MYQEGVCHGKIMLRSDKRRKRDNIQEGKARVLWEKF